MEETHKAKDGERTRGSQALSRGPLSLSLQAAANPEALQIPSLWDFMEARAIDTVDKIISIH